MPDKSFELMDQGTRILVFGKDGQVGRSLQARFKNCLASVVFLGRNDCDLSDRETLIKALNQYQPQIIVNASAYTAVDLAQQERELAFAVNRDAVAVMADYVARVPKGVLVHYSTDYVYSGLQPTPYVESDRAEPLSVYGKSKLAGDDAIIQAFEALNDLSNGSKYFILRTSWVYGDGNNFIRTMLHLATEKEHLRVVADQYGVPTSADWLALLAIQLLSSKADSGIYHAVPDGRTSWHGLALFVIELARVLGQRLKVHPNNISPICSSEYPVAAARPQNSSLNNDRLKQVLSEMEGAEQFPTWQEQLTQYIQHQVQNALKN
jgi:dTDP-4-dehydrorhamnose reductase